MSGKAKIQTQHSLPCTCCNLLPPFSWDPKMLPGSGFEVSDSTVRLWKAFWVDSDFGSPRFSLLHSPWLASDSSCWLPCGSWAKDAKDECAGLTNCSWLVQVVGEWSGEREEWWNNCSGSFYQKVTGWLVVCSIFMLMLVKISLESLSGSHGPDNNAIHLSCVIYKAVFSSVVLSSLYHTLIRRGVTKSHFAC